MLKTLKAFMLLGWTILKTNKQNTDKLFIELNSVLQKHDFQLSPIHKKRIFFYTAQSAITNHWFSLLRGFKPSKKEVQIGLYLGAFTPIADDLMDEQKVTFESINSGGNSNSADEILFNYLYNKLLPQIEQNSFFRDYFNKAHQAQNESLKQLGEKKLSFDELRDISFNKGGFYTLLYRMILQNKPLEGEEDAIYYLGSIMQLLNDLFDIHKDFHNGSQTLVINSADIHFIEKELMCLENEFKSKYLQLPYPQKNIKASFRAVMAIVTRGHVAIDYYKNLQGDKEKIDVSEFDRMALIVDMERTGNIWLNLIVTKKTVSHAFQN